MRCQRFRSQRLVNINIAKYKVVWDGDCRSKFQKQVKQWLQSYWQDDICVEEFPVPGTKLRCDLVNLTKKIIVETSGLQHVNFTPYFHPKGRFDWHGQIVRDDHKREWAETNGYIFVEIYPEDMPLNKEFFKKNYSIEI